MKAVAKYLLSKTARRQLDNIYLYTLERWGEAQAEKYLDGFMKTFSEIANGLSYSRDINPIFDVVGYFTAYEKHYIYWQKFDDDVFGIVAILHQKQNQGDRLAESLEVPFG